MWRAIIRALAAAAHLIGRGFDVFGKVARIPFDWLFGGRPMPHYDEGEQPDLRLSRLFTEDPKPDTEMIARSTSYTQVRNYIRKPNLRGTVDLSSVKQDVLDVLMSMSPAECDALACAGDSKIRLFADGQDHGVFGVPRVGVKTAKTSSVAPEIVVVESLQERIQRKLASRPFQVPKVAA